MLPRLEMSIRHAYNDGISSCPGYVMAGRYVCLVILIGLLAVPGCSSEPAGRDVAADVVDRDFPVWPDLGRDGSEPGDSAVTPDAGDVTDVDVLYSVCDMCFDDSDCSEGFECVSIDSGKVCSCVDDGDCRNGFICYAYGTPTVNVCIPEAFNCPSCSFQHPCDDGKCCDLNTESCVDCLKECQPCENDFQCAAGSRCFVLTGFSDGVCLAECTDGVCGDALQYTCQSRGSGVEVCVPTNVTCPVCTGVRPVPLPDGSCVQCVDDDDCVMMEGALGHCNEFHTCESMPTPCDGLCSDDFPVCTVVGGVEQCVQCATDADCAMIADCTCAGDPLYACVDSTGAICGCRWECSATCDDSSDCPPAQGDVMQDCVPLPGSTTGYCVDPSGHCDGGRSCCAPVQDCVDLVLVLQEIYPTVPRIIVQPDVTLTYCGCDTADDCLTGAPCTELSILCTSGDFTTEGLYELICPDGQLHEAFPDRLCVQPATLLEYFGVVPAV